MASYVKILIDVINGEVQEFPVSMNFRTDLLKPVGEHIVRYFNDRMCSVAKKTFLMNYGQEVFGTCEFTTVNGFWEKTQIMGVKYVLIDGCNATIDGMCVTF